MHLSAQLYLLNVALSLMLDLLIGAPYFSKQVRCFSFNKQFKLFSEKNDQNPFNGVFSYNIFCCIFKWWTYFIEHFFNRLVNRLDMQMCLGEMKMVVKQTKQRRWPTLSELTLSGSVEMQDRAQKNCPLSISLSLCTISIDALYLLKHICCFACGIKFILKNVISRYFIDDGHLSTNIIFWCIF